MVNINGNGVSEIYMTGVQAKEAKSLKHLWGTLGKDWRTTGAMSRPNRT